MLFTEDEENFPGIKTFEHNADTQEIIIRFVYDIPEDKKRKYAEENYQAVHDYIYKNNSTIPVWQELLKPVPTGKGKDTTTLLEKHMKAYVAKNTFDYFIHKDLKGFLTRELDFYIKSEVMHLDDLDTTDEKRVETYLAKVRAIKRVGKVIIDFLAQIEDFQKKLWLKKKFVIETNWCITLDRIDERFYPEIIVNKAQIQEWIDMYAVDEIKEDLATVGFTNPPTVEFLRQNLNLVVDTKHFTSDFKERLIASIDNLDEETGGLMINSDNYQALSLIDRKYKESIQSIYIDPPYNSNASEIIYKNGYKHSSWLTLIRERITKSYGLMKKTGVISVAVDDNEASKLKLLLDNIYGECNCLGNISVVHNPGGRHDDKYISTCHEYCYVYGKDTDYTITNNLPLDADSISTFKHNDEEGSFRFREFIRSGNNSSREERPYMFYPILLKNNNISFVEDEEVKQVYVSSTQSFDDNKLNEIIQKYTCLGFNVLLPKDSKGNYKVWRWSKESLLQRINDVYVSEKNGIFSIKVKDRLDSKDGLKPKSAWYKPQFSAALGTLLLKNILGDNPFSYPKSLDTVKDSLIISSNNEDTIMDYFAGSGTTGHAVLTINREDGGNRKYILVEMGEYFDTVTKPRMQKVIYSSDWKDGKPQTRNTGVSHIMKYMKLESYEDALSNISLDDDKHSLLDLFGEDYLIHYMLDMEAEGSLLDLDAFKAPFEYKLKITENNETKEKNVDVVETFNYLIGLTVKTTSAITYFNAVKDENGEYEGAVRLVKDISGTYGFKQIEGTTPDGKRVLIIWRTISDNLFESNAALDAYFSKHRINPQDREYDIIYVNGDNNLQNISTDEDSFKVQMTELEFKKRMFEEE